MVKHILVGQLKDHWVVVSSKDLYVELLGEPRPHVKDTFNQVYAPIAN